MRFQDTNSSSLSLYVSFSLFCFVLFSIDHVQQLLFCSYIYCYYCWFYTFCACHVEFCAFHFPTCPFIYTLNIYSCVAYGIFLFRYTHWVAISLHIISYRKISVVINFEQSNFIVITKHKKKMKTKIKWNENKWNVNITYYTILCYAIQEVLWGPQTCKYRCSEFYFSFILN